MNEDRVDAQSSNVPRSLETEGGFVPVRVSNETKHAGLSARVTCLRYPQVRSASHP
jgi:hypothetical protein